MALAEWAGMDHSLVSRLESGERNPTRDSLPPLCNALRLMPREVEALYLGAGFVPPGVDTATLAALIEIVRGHDSKTLTAALALVHEAKLALLAMTPEERAA